MKKFQVDPVVTTHKRMASGSVAPPTPKAIQSLISALQDLPEEAEKELETKEQLQAEVSRLNGELAKVRSLKPASDDSVALATAKRELEIAGKTIAEYTLKLSRYEKAMFEISRIAIPGYEPGSFQREEITPQPVLPNLHIRENLKAIKPAEASMPSILSTGVQSGPLRYLKAAAMYYPSTISKKRMCAMAGTSFKSSTHRAYMAKLKQDGLLEVIDPDTFKATAKGIKMAGQTEPLPSPGKETVDMWCAKMGKGPATYLQKLSSVYPKYIRKEDLAKACGTEYTKSTHRAYMAELRACQLIEELSDAVKAADELFT